MTQDSLLFIGDSGESLSHRRYFNWNFSLKKSKKACNTSKGMVLLISVERQAGVSELADETDSKSVVLTGVWVRVPLPAE